MSKYTKTQTLLYTSLPKNIKFEKKEYDKGEKEEKLPLWELELLDVVDVNRYNKKEL